MSVSGSKMTLPVSESTVGARLLDGSTTRFCVWAPRLARPSLRIEGNDALIELDDLGGAYFGATVEHCPAGTRYRYVREDGAEFADPASRSQPDGVHGPSEVVDLASYEWGDSAYHQRPLFDHVMYELHIGTFSPGGTFSSALEELDALVDLGVSAIEIMPVAQFPGRRNWGYDGVFTYAVQNSYGGARELQHFVDVCHQKGLAVILDVVYNHLGPEGNVLDEFAPYFNERYQTPWGPALNFDDADSDDVRDYYWLNARQWFEDFHIDALRLDAVHAILDTSATTFLAELSERSHDLGETLARRCDLIAESASNDPRVVTPLTSGGLGSDAQWNDDFHHALHVSLTGERSGYYADYVGPSDLARSLNEGFVLQGDYSGFRRRHHGAPSTSIPPERFVVFSQNHDHVGNRPRGDRLSTMVSLEQAKLAAALVVLSPNVPLLFMGEEYGEVAPFPYFIDHGDAALVQSIREGRAREFADLAEEGALYDPASVDTYEAAVLNHALRKKNEHRALFEHYQRLIALRRATPALRRSSREHARAWASGNVITLERADESGNVTVFFNLSSGDAVTPLLPSGHWRGLLGEEQPENDAPVLTPWGFAVYGEVPA
jgi:maltooligosyltrehalose trehalohydrolase